MKRHNYLIKNLIVVAICSFILCTITCYYAWGFNKANNELDFIKNNYHVVLAELDSTKNELSATKEILLSEVDKLDRLNEELENKNRELEEANVVISTIKSDEYEFVYIGDFTLTHYCCEKRKHICGTGAGITATGTQVTAGRTVAVDPSVIPYGTEVYIEGYGWRVAEDCGGAVKGNHIDVAVETHSQAISMGTTSGGVWILVKKGS